MEQTQDIQTIKFTQEDIQAVREAIQKAREDMKEWHTAEKISPERMQTPLRRKTRQ